MGGLDALVVVDSIDDMRFMVDLYPIDIMGSICDMDSVDVVNFMVSWIP